MPSPSFSLFPDNMLPRISTRHVIKTGDKYLTRNREVVTMTGFCWKRRLWVAKKENDGGRRYYSSDGRYYRPVMQHDLSRLFSA